MSLRPWGASCGKPPLSAAATLRMQREERRTQCRSRDARDEIGPEGVQLAAPAFGTCCVATPGCESTARLQEHAECPQRPTLTGLGVRGGENRLRFSQLPLCYQRTAFQLQHVRNGGTHVQPPAFRYGRVHLLCGAPRVTSR